MKKTNIFLILLLSIFSCIITVNAATNPFKYDWETEAIYEPLDFALMYSNKIYFDNGYVESFADTEKSMQNNQLTTKIVKYNIKGEQISTVELTGQMVMSFVTDETSLYVLLLDMTDKSLSLQIYDKNLKETKEIEITLAADDSMSEFYAALPKLLGMNVTNMVDNKIYFCTSKYINEINLETSKTTQLETNDDNMKLYFPNIYKAEEKTTEDTQYFSYDKDLNKEVYAGFNSQECTVEPSSITASKDIIAAEEFLNPTDSKANCTKNIGVVSLYENNELVFDKQYTDYQIIGSAKIINDYVVAIGMRINETTNVYYLEIIVLDMEGNIVQKITNSEYYFNIEKGPTSFKVLAINAASSNKCEYLSQGEKSGKKECNKVNHEVYYLPLNIETKVEGSGKVIANTTSRYGEEIIFTVQPEKGYVLGAVSVTDKNGNTVTFTDYTFTMPSADVTIEATFVKEQIVVNPETSAFAIIVAIIIAIIGGVTFNNTKKKLTWLK